MVRADLINRFTFIYYKRFNELCTIDGRIPLNLTSCEVKVYDTYRGGEMVEKIPDNFIHILFNSDKLYKIPENILPKRVETLELNNILLEMYPKNINSLSINIKKPINIYDDNINITINLDSDIRINNLYTKIDILGRHKIKLPRNKIEMLKLSKSNLSKIYNFPEYVRELDISNNKLKFLPKLPNNLIKLNCSNNRLSKLPELCNSLRLLNCSLNKIIELPKLPDKLIYLYCENNLITWFNKLPDDLEVFRFTNNPVKICPYFPKNIKEIMYINDTKIKNTFKTVYNIPKSCLILNIQSESLKNRPIDKRLFRQNMFVIGNTQGNILNYYLFPARKCSYRHIEHIVKKIQRRYRIYKLKKMGVPRQICYFLQGDY